MGVIPYVHDSIYTTSRRSGQADITSDRAMIRRTADVSHAVTGLERHIQAGICADALKAMRVTAGLPPRAEVAIDLTKE